MLKYHEGSVVDSADELVSMSEKSHLPYQALRTVSGLIRFRNRTEPYQTKCSSKFYHQAEFDNSSKDHKMNVSAISCHDVNEHGMQGKQRRTGR